MGACDFHTLSKGRTASEAFSAARDQAAHEHGHGGYTGTIAEKNEFVEIKGDAPVCGFMDKKAAFKLANKLMDDDDDRVSDKFGPAGCIAVGPDEWLFFGFASS